jgi:phenylalanyl-tRNA synthetase beta chain
METLDHQERELTSEMLMIADADHAVAVAGVMGGVDSEVSDNTTNLLLEGANFDMKSVRHTRMALKLRTDASSRFERGLDPNLVGPAMARATRLLLDLNPGSRVVAMKDVYPNPPAPKTITMKFDRIERVIGIRYEPELVTSILNRLEFAVKIDESGLMTVDVPSYRRDVSIQEDIIEEVARVAGYEHLPSTLPSGALSEIKRDPMYRLKEAVRRTLTASGLSEAVTYVTVSSEQLAPFETDEGNVSFVRTVPQTDLLRIINPLQADRNLLRPTLIPSLLDSVTANTKHESSVRLFELARVYLPRGRDQLPNEVEIAGLVMTGEREQLSRFGDAGEMDFFDLAGVVESLLDRTGLSEIRIEQACSPGLHPGRTAAAFSGDRRIAVYGELLPAIAREWDLDEHRVLVAEIDLTTALSLLPERVSQVSVPRFLPVEQDFAIVVDEATPAADVNSALRAGAGPLVTAVTLFDIYQGPQIGEGKKSLAYRVTFTAPDRALTDAELVKVRTRIEKSLEQQVSGALRV